MFVISNEAENRRHSHSHYESHVIKVYYKTQEACGGEACDVFFLHCCMKPRISEASRT